MSDDIESDECRYQLWEAKAIICFAEQSGLSEQDSESFLELIGVLERKPRPSESELDNSEEFLEVDIEGEYGTPQATSKLLESVADVLKHSPNECRYDVKLVLDEQIVQ